MKRHVTSALWAGAITVVSGIGLFAGMSGSKGWFVIPAYVLMAPGLYLAFFLGLGSGAHGAVLHTDIAHYVLTFFVWWGIVEFARASWRWRHGGTRGRQNQRRD